MVGSIEKLLTTKSALTLSDAVRRRVTYRALAGLAPYHRSKNSVGDAILVETYADASARRSKRRRFGFVTHNVKDFSDSAGDRRLPHPDLAGLFDGATLTHWTSLPDVIRAEGPDLFDDRDFEFNYAQQPRRLSEIMEAEHLLFRQVWYNRHWNLRHAIETGKVKVMPEGEQFRDHYRPGEVLDTIWAGALAAAKKTEDEVGPEHLGPWSDFEWGMVNGKLSALRWVLGDDWDMLDT